MPSRIQRSRAKGWRMPEGAIYVGRPTPWGNPFVVGLHGKVADCILMYRALLSGYLAIAGAGIDDTHIEAQKAARAHVLAHLAELRGHDLACWCRAGHACHADILIELANA